MLGVGAKKLPKMAEVLPFSVFPLLIHISFWLEKWQGLNWGNV